MQINAATHSPYADRRVPATNPAASTSYAAALAAKTTQSNPASPSAPESINQVDFTSMTRQDMRDWVNAQILSGEMSLDESSPFTAMTVKVSLDGQIVDSAGDSTRLNFIERTHRAIEGARQRNDHAAVAQWQEALDIMQSHQGETIGIDTRA